MKVLFYSHSSTLYGATSSLLDLIRGINHIDKGIEMYIVLPKEGPLIKVLQEEQINYSVIPNRIWTYNKFLFDKKNQENPLTAKIWYYKHKLTKEINNRFWLSKHLKFAKEYSPDIIYANSSMAPMGAYVAAKLKRKFVWHHRETVNDLQTGFFLENTKKFNNFFSQADLHLYPSKFLKTSYEEFNNKGKQVACFDGVFSGNYDPQKINLPSTPIKFGLIGRINQQKGQEEILRIFSELNGFENKCELHIYGGGEGRFIKQLEEKYGRVNVYFHGFCARDIIYNNLHFVIVNAKNESFGRVVGEANAFNVPVLALKSGALNEIVFDGLNGYKYSDIDDFKNILFNILNEQSFDKFYTKLKLSSKEIFKDNFTIETHAAKVLKELKRL